MYVCVYVYVGTTSIDALIVWLSPIPTNDIWIAAAAYQHGLKLFTGDRHFLHVAGLVLFLPS